MTERYPDDEPVIAALSYATLALMQKVRPDVLLPMGGHPPDSPAYAFPTDWTWEPGQTPRENLRKARLLIDASLAEEGEVVVEDGFPSQGAIANWARQFKNSVLIQALQVLEELGEVARCIVKREQGLRGTSEEWDLLLRKELGDLFISSTNLAELCGYDYAVVATLRWMDVGQRDFLADPKGHGLPVAG